MVAVKIEPVDEKAPIPAYNSFEVPTAAYTSRKRSEAFRWDRNKHILNNVTEATGLTPMVRLSRICSEHDIDPSITILAKLEYFNPGGSIKDRIAESMFSVIPKTEDTVVIEASSGNTACGLAMNAAVHNVQSLFTIPNTCSIEKESILKAFGSQVIRSESNQPWHDSRSYLGVARRAETAVRNSGGDAFYLDQYQHPRNPAAHYQGTADEIYEQTNGNIDYVVMGVGTGGTVVGVGTRLKELIKTCKVIAVQPEGSVLDKDPPAPASKQPRSVFKPDEGTLSLERLARSWKVEGIGKKYRPPVLTHGVVDSWLTISDSLSFETARQLIRCEGILAGGSSGSAVAACLHLAKLPESKGRTFVVIIPDGARNYISTFLDDGWMALNGCGTMAKSASYDFWLKIYKEVCVDKLITKVVCTKYSTLMKDATVADAVDRMKVDQTRHVLVADSLPVLFVQSVVTVCSLEDLRNIEGTTRLEDVNVNKHTTCEPGYPIAKLMSALDEMTRLWNLRNPAVIFYNQAPRTSPRARITYAFFLISSDLVHQVKVSDLVSCE